ncbi:hypothetical protein VTJ04DRAFT_6883 [Mycothermus thermophilus]|uniref:uncharacterized protein n=1 Tax=Humicola insolens TaxID=85995 RepID=UPI0037423151
MNLIDGVAAAASTVPERPVLVGRPGPQICRATLDAFLDHLLHLDSRFLCAGMACFATTSMQPEIILCTLMLEHQPHSDFTPLL